MATKNLVSGGSDSQRRSQRVILSVAVVVFPASRTNKGKDAAPTFEEETRTLVVNAHGALIALVARVEKDELLRIKNQSTRAEQMVKVIYVGPSSGGKTQIGVEFTSPAPEFWNIVFPPEDWAPSAAPQPPKPVKQA